MTWTTHNDGSGPSWISGLYKITRYERSLSDQVGVHYRAYVKRRGATCWGWHPYPETPYYSTLEVAQGACANHLKETHVEIEAR